MGRVFTGVITGGEIHRFTGQTDTKMNYHNMSLINRLRLQHDPLHT